MIAVLGSCGGWHVRDLERAAAERGMRLAPVDFRHLAATVGSGPPAGGTLRAEGVDLRRARAVLVRGMPGGTLEQVVWRMDALHGLRDAGVPVWNPPRALECAIDKYLSLLRLARAGLPVPRTAVAERPGDALRAFEELGGDVLAKPLFGSEGRGIESLTSRAAATEAAERLAGDPGLVLLQERIDHPGEDLRAFVLRGRVLAAMRRRGEPGQPTNVAQGGRPEKVALDPAAEALALRAAGAVGAEVAGVDLVPGPAGTLHVLEVNAVPGWRALAAVSGVDVAGEVLGALLESRAEDAA